MAEHRIAFFHRAHSNLYRGLNSGRIRYAFFDLISDLEQHYARLEELSPTLIIGPPFALRRLGDARRTGQLRIGPTGLLSVAEVLDDAERTRIEEDFGVSVDQAYVATEGFIAATCVNGSLHVNEDLLVMQREWLDRSSGRFVPIITDFRRRVQPVLRYRLDDVLVDGTHGCDCGSVFAVLERIEGRRDDVLILQSRQGEQLRRIFPDFVRRAVCLASADIRDYRIVQETVDRVGVELTVASASRDHAQRAVLDSLVAMFQKHRCVTPTIYFRPPSETNPRCKVRRVVRDFPSEWN